MPKIQINERDLSWYYRQREPGQLVVLMPGVATWGPVFSSDDNDYPILINEENFTKVLGDKPVHFNEDFSYHMAMSFVKAGIDVYFLRIDPGFTDNDTASANTGNSEGVAGVYSCSITTAAAVGDTIKINGIVLKATSDWGNTTALNASKIVEILNSSVYENDSRISGYTWAVGTDDNANVITITEKSNNIGAGRPTIEAKNNTSLAVSISTITEGKSAGTNLTIKAKYPGSFGSRLSVITFGSGNIRNIRVYLDQSTLVEDIICDFSDVYSQYYYEQVTRNTQYIDIEATGFNSNGGNVTEFLPLTFSGDPANTPAYYHDKVGESEFDRSNIVDKLKSSLYNRSDSQYTSLFNDLCDPLIYNFGVIVDGGYNDCSDLSISISDIDRYFTDLAKKRQDTIYLVSGSSGMTPDLFYSYCGFPDDDPSTSNVSTFDTSFAAAFGPWCYSRLVSNGSIRELPGYYPFLIAWGQSMSNGNPIWLAPAGVKRASLGDIVSNTKYFVGSSVVDMWQNQEYVTSRGSTWKVNPICRLKQYGFVVYGNSTLLKNYHNGAMSMLQSFSVRVMVNLIKTRAFDISLTLQFDQLSKEIFGEFKTLMGTFLDQLRRSEALYDYKIIADRSEMTLDDLNNRTVPVKILISPTPTAENFIINLEISKAGVTFSDEGPETTELING